MRTKKRIRFSRLFPVIFLSFYLVFCLVIYVYVDGKDKQYSKEKSIVELKYIFQEKREALEEFVSKQFAIHDEIFKDKELLQRLLTSDTLSDEYKQARIEIKKIFSNTDVEIVGVTDKTGKMVVNKLRERERYKIILDLDRKDKNQDIVFVVTPGLVMSTYTLDIGRPVRDKKGELIGFSGMAIPLKKLDQILNDGFGSYEKHVESHLINRDFLHFKTDFDEATKRLTLRSLLVSQENYVDCFKGSDLEIKEYENYKRIPSIGMMNSVVSGEGCLVLDVDKDFIENRFSKYQYEWLIVIALIILFLCIMLFFSLGSSFDKTKSKKIVFIRNEIQKVFFGKLSFLRVIFYEIFFLLLLAVYIVSIQYSLIGGVNISILTTFIYIVIFLLILLIPVYTVKSLTKEKRFILLLGVFFMIMGTLFNLVLCNCKDSFAREDDLYIVSRVVSGAGLIIVLLAIKNLKIKK